MNGSTLLVLFGVIAIVLMFAVFCLSMYLGKFPFVRTRADIDFKNNSFKADLEVKDNEKERD